MHVPALPRPRGVRSFLCAFRVVALLGAVAAGGAAARAQFVHPGGLHTQADLDRMKNQVAAGAHPWSDGWNKLIADPEAQNTYNAAPQANMGVSRQRASADAHAAYLNAIRWYVSGDTSYADCAVRICDGWSAAVNQVPTGTDTPGLIGIPIAELAYAAEVLRLYPGWAPSDFARFQAMMETYLYPVAHDFLTNHNGTCDTHYWANWDLANVGAILGIGVLCDDPAKFNEAVAYYQNGIGNGSLLRAVCTIHPDGLGQWQESGRDQEHAQLGVGLAAAFCQVAWNQGVDLFGTANNRLLAGAEYVARTNLCQPVPYATYNNCDNVNQYFLSRNGLGRIDDRPVWELLYNHFVVRKGLSAPNVAAMAGLTRPEHGSADHFGYGTLTFTLDAAASPFPALPVPAAPTHVAATAGVGRVALSWDVPADNTAAGYLIQRATAAAGPFATVATTSQNTFNEYTDAGVAAGTTYFYQVTATNQTGTGPASATVSATPVAAGAALPPGWASADVGAVSATGSASYGDAMGGTFLVAGSGTGLGGAADSGGFTGAAVAGDAVLVARLSGVSGSWNKAGVMIRESLAPDAPMILMKLGDVGDREGGAGVRLAAGGTTTWYAGDDYTWLPAWLKVERSGSTFTASQSDDGTHWMVVASATITMADTAYVGLVSCSGSSTGGLLTATFDHVALTGSVLAAPPSTVSAVNGYNQVTVTWTASAFATGYNVKRSTTPGGPYVTIATGVSDPSYVDSGLPNGPTYYYVVSAVEGGFESANSAEVAGTPGDITDLWNAAATSGSWSVPGNWTGGAAPVSGVSLAFGGSAVTALTNDLTGLTVNRLTFNSSAPALTIAGSALGVTGTIQNNAAATQTISAPIALNGARTVVAASGNLTLSGVVSDGTAASTLTKSGTQALFLTGQNTFTGGVVLSSGSLVIAGAGSGSAGAPTAGPLGRGPVQLNAGTLASSAAATVYNPLVVPAGASANLSTASAALTLAGNLSGAGTINESGANTGGTHLAGDNSGFTGTFNSSNATGHRVRFDAASAGSANAAWVLNNAQTDGYGLTFGNATIAFGALSGGGVFRNDSPAASSVSTISLGALNTNTTFTGTMVQNSGRAIAVRKVGTGTLTFTGTHTFTAGTTVTAGTFLLNSPGSLASAVTAAAGTFGGTGRVNAAVTVGTGSGSGATLAPGSGGIGTLATTGALTLNSDATLAIEFNSASAAADKVAAGSVSLGNATLTLTDLGSATLPSGTVFTLIDNTGTTAVAGTFNGLPEGAILTVGGNWFQLSYQGGTGNDVVLTSVVPPPAVTSANSATGTVGVPFSYVISGSNSPTAFAVSSVPAGLSFDPTTGTISGVPATAGTVAATIGVANATGSASAPLTFVIGRGTATVSFTGLAQTYSGHPAAVGVTTSPQGLAVTISYAGGAAAPVNAGTYEVTADVADPNYRGSASDVLVIAPATPAVAVTPYAVTYDGAAHTATGAATGVRGEALAGLAVGGTTHTNAGTYADTWTFVDPTGNYATASGAISDVIAPAAASIAVTGYAGTYDGAAHGATGTATGVNGAAVTNLLSLGATFTNVPGGTATWTFHDPQGNYADASGTAAVVLARAAPAVSVSGYTVVYDAAAHTATGSVSGVRGEILGGLDLAATTHTGAGAYTDAWVFTDSTGNYTNAAGQVSDTITQATATLALTGLTAWYDGTPKPVTVATDPSGLAVNLSYDGGAAAPIYPGTHVVSATITDPNYSGTSSATLTIGITALVNHAPVLNGTLDGSLQVRQPENVSLNSGTTVAGDLLVPGTPAITVSNTATYGGTLDGPGAATPGGAVVTLNAGVALRHLVRRVDAIPLPTVSAPPVPAGTRDVTVNSGGSIGDPATVRNLILNGSAGAVSLPPGTYGAITVNGGATLVLGVAGSPDPVGYNLQGLTLNGGATVAVVGPVVVTLAKGPSLNGNAGSAANPGWVTLCIAGDAVSVADDTTLNGNVLFYGSIVDPTGTLTVNGRAQVYGRVVADRLTINGNGLVSDPQ